MKKAIIEFIFTILLCGSFITFGILYKSPLTEFKPIMNEIFEWFVNNYIMVIIGVSVILILITLKNLLLKIK